VKLSFVLGTAVAGLALTGWAQVIKEAQPLKPHPSNEFKVHEGEASKSGAGEAPPTRSSGAKDLRHIETEHPKGVSTAKKLPVSGVAEKQRSSAKINFAGNISPKGQSTRKALNPYQGRLKQKGPRH
jgi:hypothetical protein